MAVLLNGLEALASTITTNGAVIPAATGETAMTAAITSGSSLAPEAAIKAHGSQSAKVTPVTTGPVYARTASSGGVLTAACDMLIRVPSLTAPGTGSEPFLLQAVGVGGGTLFSATWVPTTGYLRQRAAAATTGTVAFNPSTAFLRIGMYVNINTATPASSTCHIAAYALDSNTPIIDLGTIPGSPTTTGVQLDYFKFGRANTDSDTSVFYLDDMRWDYAATDMIPVTAGAALSCTTAVTPTSGTAPLAVSSTITPNGGSGSAITYDWSWGDGSTTAAQSSPTATHTYSSAGTYTVTGAANQT